MTEHDKPDRSLPTKQQRAIAALMVARDTVEAAKIAGITPRTLYRWQKDPAFAAELAAVERGAIDQATRRLIGGTQGAIDTILDVMQDEEAPPPARLRAAMAWLDYHHKFRELNDIEERLAALEERIGNG